MADEDDDVDRAAALMLAQIQSATLDGVLEGRLSPAERVEVDRALRDGAYSMLHAIRHAHLSRAAQRLVQGAQSLVPPDWDRPQLLQHYARERERECSSGG